MITVFTELSLSEMRAEIEAIAADAQRAFSHLNTQQLNWKPSAESWSVAQCLDHLLTANDEMFRPMDETMAGTKQPAFFERLPVLPGLFGKLMVNAVSPQAKRKLKAPSTAKPAASALDAQIVSRFVSQQRDIIERLKRLERLDASRLVMTSPFVRFITYSVLDACRVIVAHERRHLAQAQRVMETPGFPR